jgi:hypothetical protein
MGERATYLTPAVGLNGLKTHLLMIIEKGF